MIWKKCPCCEQIITVREYIKQSAIYGEYTVPDTAHNVQCPACKNVVVTEKRIGRVQGFAVALSILVSAVISILFFSKKQIILASIPGGALLALIYQYSPYYFLKMKCYTDKELREEKAKYVSVFPFFFLIFILCGIGFYLVFIVLK